MVGISADTVEQSIKFAQRKGIEFPLLTDDGVRVSNAYGVAMEDMDIPVPAALVVLPDRTIFWKEVGETMAATESAKAILKHVDLAIERLAKR
jgi:peroxiredoxin